MDGPSRTEQSTQHVCGLNTSQRAPASKGLGKTPSWVQALPQDSAAREPHCHEWQAWKTNAGVQMLIEASSKPHDIVIYTDGSITRDQSDSGFPFYPVKQGRGTTWRQWFQQCHGLQSDHGDGSSHTCNTIASLQMLSTDDTCHHSHRLTEPAVKDGSLEMEWAALTGTHSHSHASLQLQRLLWVHCCGHAWVSGNEWADRLASIHLFIVMDCR